MPTSPPYFIDTNIFIYTLFNVNRQKHHACIKLFKLAQAGKTSLWTTEWVTAELIWFLHKQKFTWEKTKSVITQILATSGLKVRGKKWILAILALCPSAKDFIDAANITLALSENITSGYSYDKDLDQWPQFTRLKP